ncbi:MAG: hypothetical protein C5B49_00080 [Bdellovibrio sp.]|nr:MAG: hypothetical protein C5B49_00080 [Bdellovibrio sp.]
MKRRISVFSYPLLISQELEYIVLSVPDLHIWQVMERPGPGGLTPKYLFNLAKDIAKTWLKVQQRLKDFENANKRPPPPSIPKRLFSETESQRLSTREAAQLLGISENTLRRLADRRIIPSRKSRGGHRSFLEAHILQYRESRTLRKKITSGEIGDDLLGELRKIARRNEKKTIEVVNELLEKTLLRSGTENYLEA